MTEEAKEQREFVVIAEGEAFFFHAKTPRAAAVKALNTATFEGVASVEVLEVGRGKKYVRQSTAVPAGKDKA